MESKIFISFILILVLIGTVSATHFRFGTISYRIPDANKPNTVEFYSSFTFRRSFFGKPNVGSTIKTGTFSFGDGTSSVNLNLVVSTINEDADWAAGTFTTTHTYPNREATYTAKHTSTGRIRALNNNGNMRWNVTCTVSIGRKVLNRDGVSVYNTAPVSNNLPIVSVYSDEVNEFRITASDAEGQTLVYSLGTKLDMGSNSHSLVPKLTVSSDGLVRFDTRNVKDGYWCTQIKFHDGYAYSVVDFLIHVAPRPRVCHPSCSNNGASCTTNSGCRGCDGGAGCVDIEPPKLIIPPTPLDTTAFTVNVNEPFVVSWSAYSSSAETVTVTTSSLPATAVVKTTLPRNPFNQTLTWTPTLSDVGVYVITLGCVDSKGQTCTGQSSFSITVVKPFCGFGRKVGNTCVCDHAGYNASTQCYECVANHYGRDCTSCPPCDKGICDTGFSGVGGCTCNVGWQGTDCSFPLADPCDPTTRNYVVSRGNGNQYVNPSITYAYLSKASSSPLSLTLTTNLLAKPTKIDVLLLVDLTKSISQSMLNNLQGSYGRNFFNNVRDLVPNSFVGLASFTDRPTGPGCSSNDYPFRLHLPLSSDRTDFTSALSSYMKSTSLGCNDNDNRNDSQMDALVLATAANVGWRSDAYKVVVVVTDSTFWDGTNGYNSRADARAALAANNIIPIFIASGVSSTYANLVSDYRFGFSASVYSDFSNALTQAYNQIENSFKTLSTIVAEDTYGFVSDVDSSRKTISRLPSTQSNTVEMKYPSGAALDSLENYPEIKISTMGWGISTVVAQVNRAPNPAVCTATTREDIEVLVPITGSDPDGNALSVYLTRLPAKGHLTVSQSSDTRVVTSTKYTIPDGSPTPFFRYIPDLHVHGSDTFQYYLSDGCSVSATVTCSITITDFDYPPTASDSYITTDENKAVRVTMSGEDVETPSTGLIYFVTTLPDPNLGVLRRVSNNALVVVNEKMGRGEDTILFVPVDYACCDIASFYFQVQDSAGQLSDPQTAEIEIFGINQTPTPSASNVVVNRGANVSITLKAWDPDYDDVETFTITSLSAGVGGAFFTSTNAPLTTTGQLGAVPVDSTGNAAITVYYTAPVDKSGSNYARITFTVTDSAGATSSAYTVYASVNTVNNVPNANPAGPITLLQDSSSAIWNLNGTDADAADAKLIVQIVALPTKGTLTEVGKGNVPNTLPFTLTNPNVYFSTNLTGDDSFSFRVVDLMGAASLQQGVRISITPVNHAPTASFLPVSFPEDTMGTLQISPYDQDGDVLKVVLSTPTQGSFYQFDGTRIDSFPATVADSKFRFKFLGAPNMHGSPYANFTFYVDDQQNKPNSHSATVHGEIHVTPVNDPPVASPFVVTLDENSDPVTFTLEATDIETPTTVAAYLVTKPSASLGTIKQMNGAVLDVRTVVDSPRNVTFHPNPYQYGTTTFSFAATDGELNSQSATATIVVRHVNHAPSASATSPVTASRAVPLSVSLVIQDFDIGDNLTVTVTGFTGRGSLAYEGSTITVGKPLPVFTIPSSNSRTISLTYLAPADATPGAEFARFNFSAVDQGGLSTGSVSVSISIANNNPPVANPAGPLPVKQDYKSVPLPLNGTDIDVADAGKLTVVIVSLPGRGKLLQGSSDTEITRSNFDLPTGVTTVSYLTTQRGADSFTFAVRDLLGTLSAPVTVNIPITNTNHAPTAVWIGTATANEDSVLLITNIQASDPDAGDVVKVRIVAAPSVGTLTQADDTPCDSYPCEIIDGQFKLKFTPVANEFSTNQPYASISIYAWDGALESPVVQGNLFISPVNDAPIANNTVVTTDENVQKTITFDVGDIDTAFASLSVVIQSLPDPAIGSITTTTGTVLKIGSSISGMTEKQLIFVPTKWAHGSTSFTFNAYDGELYVNFTSFYNQTNVFITHRYSSIATVSITVSPVYQPPECSISPSPTMAVGRSTTSTIQLSVFDPDQETYTFYMTSFAQNGGSIKKGSTTIDSTSAVLQDNVNTNPPTYTGYVDLTYIVDASESATSLTLSFVVFDGRTNSSQCTLDLTSSENEAPNATFVEPQTIDEDTLTDVLILNGTDIDNFGELLRVVIIDLPKNGILYQNSPNKPIDTSSTLLDEGSYGVYYVPTRLWDGVDSFSFAVRDVANALSAKSTVIITVNHVNHDPTISAGGPITTLEDTPVLITSVIASDVDVGDTVTIYLRHPPKNGQFAQHDDELITNTESAYPIPLLSNHFKFIPAENANGLAYANFTVFARDNSGAESDNITVIINVTPVDDAPVAVPVNLDEDEQEVSTPIPLLLNATDVDTDSEQINATILSLPSSNIGYLKYADDSVVSLGDIIPHPRVIYFVPNAYSFGNTSFSFNVKDQTSYSESATASIGITHVNHNPTAKNATGTAVRGVPLVITLSGSDPDAADVFHFVVVSVTSGLGGEFKNPAGEVISAPNVNISSNISNTASRSFSTTVHYTAPATASGDAFASLTYIVSDQSGGESSVQTLTIDISPNSAPIATPAIITAYQDTPSPSVALTGTDADPADADNLVLTIVTLPSRGVLIVNSTLNITEPGTVLPAGTNVSYYTIVRGTDSFSYYVTDNLGTVSGTAIGTVNIIPVNHAPTAVFHGPATGNEDTNITINQIVLADSDGDTVVVYITSVPESGLLTQYDGTPILEASPESPVSVTESHGWVKYIPARDQFGDPLASFTFYGDDGQEEPNSKTEIITANITVYPVNDRPVAHNGITAADENSDDILITLNVTDVDSPIANLSIYLTTLPDRSIGSLVDPVSLEPIALLANIPSRQVLLQLVQFSHGETSFSFFANDGLIDSASAGTQTISIASVNQAPRASAASLINAVRTIPAAITVEISDDDMPEYFNYSVISYHTLGGYFSYDSIEMDNSASTSTPFVLASNVSKSLSGTTLVVYFTAPADMYGNDFANISLQVVDAAGDKSPVVSVSVNVLRGNRPVASVIDTITFNEETTSQKFVLNGTDADVADEASLKVIITSLPTKAVLYVENDDGTVTEIATPDVVLSNPTVYLVGKNLTYGSDSFTFVVVDSVNYTSATSTVPIEIIHVNHPPVAGASISTGKMNSDLSFLVFGQDPDNDIPLSIYITALPTVGTLFQADGTPVPNTTSVDSPALVTNVDGKLIYSPPTNQWGFPLANISIYVDDNSGAANNKSAILEANLSLERVDLAPTVNNVTLSMLQGDALDFNIVANDVQNYQTYVTILTFPLYGTLYRNDGTEISPASPITQDGKVTYIPPRSAYDNGVVPYASITYRATAVSNTSLSSTVAYATISVIKTFGAPIFTGATQYDIAENTNLTMLLTGYSETGDYNIVILTPVASDRGFLFQRMCMGEEGCMDEVINDRLEMDNADMDYRVRYASPLDKYGNAFANFTIIVTDGFGQSEPILITINIYHINIPPVIVPWTYDTVNKEGQIQTYNWSNAIVNIIEGNDVVIAWKVTDKDSLEENLTSIIYALPYRGHVYYAIETTEGYVAGDQINKSGSVIDINTDGLYRLVYRPLSGKSGNNYATFSLIGSDQIDQSARIALKINVEHINLAPWVQIEEPQWNTTAGTAVIVTGVTVNDTDASYFQELIVVSLSLADGSPAPAGSSLDLINFNNRSCSRLEETTVNCTATLVNLNNLLTQIIVSTSEAGSYRISVFINDLGASSADRNSNHLNATDYVFLTATSSVETEVSEPGSNTVMTAAVASAAGVGAAMAAGVWRYMSKKSPPTMDFFGMESVDTQVTNNPLFEDTVSMEFTNQLYEP